MKIGQLDDDLSAIYHRIIESEPKAESISAGVHKKYRLSAKNLYRYLTLRSYDLRKFHDSLSDLGISSIRSAEGYVFSNLHNVIKLLRLLQNKTFTDHNIEVIGYKRSKKLMRTHANKLFNEKSKEHFTEIMVTMPDEAAENIKLVREMVDAGMEIARINLSHGNPEQWKRMVKNIQKVQKALKTPVKIYMDLAGPKLRTGNIALQNGSKKAQDRIHVKSGEHILLTKRKVTGTESVFDKKGIQLEKAVIPIQLPQVIEDVKKDHLVYFDDGMIKAKVLGKNHENVELKILEAHKTKLAAHKGINLPDTRLHLPALTPGDIELLPFVAKYADIVGYSFVRKPQDVRILYEELNKLDNKNLGIVFKIENQRAFENLPLILLEGMKRKKIGVMIARGDLAVEIGFERISEVQNQILWLCESAHIPVIWATQVLETLAKKGKATRAEISDAAKSAQADCVMLNKGPHIIKAIKTLKDILIKMECHNFKKKDELRPLHVAENALNSLD